MALVNKIFSVPSIVKSAITIAFFSLSLMVTQQSYAQDTPCDPEYMQALEARAWLEMNREITQNQNLIAKPDSVLEYTCFNHFLDEVADNHGTDRQFSETTRWGPVAGFSPSTTNTALQQVVGMAFMSYINSNFSHTYLGGRSTLDYTAATATVSDGATYTCAQMSAVWRDAKCTDFFEYANRTTGHPSNLDGFMDFYWYRDNDPRDLPPTMAACPRPLGAYNRAIQTAFNHSSPNRSATRYIIPTALDVDFATGGSYAVDDVITHLDFILPQGNPLVPSCQTINTGIRVNRVLIPIYDDAICPNPGCHYNRTTCIP